MEKNAVQCYPWPSRDGELGSSAMEPHGLTRVNMSLPEVINMYTMKPLIKDTPE